MRWIPTTCNQSPVNIRWTPTQDFHTEDPENTENGKRHGSEFRPQNPLRGLHDLRVKGREVYRIYSISWIYSADFNPEYSPGRHGQRKKRRFGVPPPRIPF